MSFLKAYVKYISIPVIVFLGMISLVYGSVYGWPWGDSSSTKSKTTEVNAKIDNKPPINLIGKWHQTKTENDILMEATISSGSIQIDMKTRDSNSIYWMGSFDTSKNSSSSFEIVSKGDQDAMSMSIFGSQDKTKKFTYIDGDLSFKFTMMGTTSTIHLSK